MPTAPTFYDAPPYVVGDVSPEDIAGSKFPCLVQHCTDYGLCNRLRGWAAIGAVADLRGKVFLTCWERAWSCDSCFSDLFIPDSCAVCTPSAWSTCGSVRVFKGKHATLTPSKYGKRLNNSRYRAAMVGRVRSLKLQPHLQQQLDTFMLTVPTNTVGVHVRRTDLSHRLGGADRRMHVALRKLISRNPSVSFLLCTDNFAQVEEFRQRYHGRVYWREQPMLAEQKGRRCTDIADAAVDLYALARTRSIVGTAHSSFSKYAGLLGHIELTSV